MNELGQAPEVTCLESAKNIGSAVGDDLLDVEGVASQWLLGFVGTEPAKYFCGKSLNAGLRIIKSTDERRHGRQSFLALHLAKGDRGLLLHRRCPDSKVVDELRHAGGRCRRWSAGRCRFRVQRAGSQHQQEEAAPPRARRGPGFWTRREAADARRSPDLGPRRPRRRPPRPPELSTAFPAS